MKGLNLSNQSLSLFQKLRKQRKNEMTGNHENTYWEVDSEYFTKIIPLMGKRQIDTDLDLFLVIKEMSECAKSMESEDFDFNSLDAIFEDTKNFYLNFALFIKFLYPIMEQVETIIQNHMRIKKYVDEDGKN